MKGCEKAFFSQLRRQKAAIGAALFLFGLVLIVTTGLPFNTSGMTQTLAEVKSVFASNFTGIGLLIACMAMLKLKVVKKTEE